MRPLFSTGQSAQPVLQAPEVRHGRQIPVIYVQADHALCAKTISAFRTAGAQVEVIDVAFDEAAAADLRVCGYSEFPVVHTALATWSGHQPARIRAFIEAAGDIEASS